MRRIALLLPLLLFALTPDASAQGIVLERIRIQPPEPPPRGPLPIRLQEHRVKIRIVDQVAEVEVEQVFFNPNPWEMEGVYLFPLPEGAALSRFTMTMGGKVVEGEVLDAERAREIYRSIVYQRRDPGLLEFAGRACLRASLFPIPPRGETRVTLRYAQVLTPEGGLVELAYPMKSDRFGPSAVAISGEIDVRSSGGVATFFSPTHKLDIVRKSDIHVVGSFEDRQSAADSDLRILYGLGNKDFGVTVTSAKPAGEDGTFLILLAPRAEIDAKDILPKDIIFVLDTSGSMGERGGAKMRQAKAALTYALGRLDARHRFNVIAFSTEARPFRDALVEATRDNVDAAVAYGNGLNAAGGTAIHDALVRALALPRSDGRVPLVIFLTDGQATIGPTDTKAILKAARDANVAQARLFVFGVGDDVNATLLTALADENRGSGNFVSEREDIEVKVSALYEKVASPVLTDARLELGDLGVYDVYPRGLGDLFKGQLAVVVGRYKKSGPRALTLRGRIGAKEYSFVYEAQFGGGGGGDFLPRLWAVRKVGYLLEEIRKNGEQRELVDEARALGIRYGILTPYTSFLVVEEDELRRRNPPPAGDVDASPAPGRVRDEAAAEARKAGDAFSDRAEAGSEAVAGARLVLELKEEETASDATGIGVKMVGGKTFRFQEGVWRDTSLPAQFTSRKVTYLSDDYGRLLADTTLARYLSVGERVIVQHQGTVFEIVSD
ncbi:MAG: VIT domain-containing protein [Planctomycetaceae bacterium]